MKKYLMALFLLMSQYLFSQEIQKKELKYDSDFNPYIELSIKNSNIKSVTSIEFLIVYRWKYANMMDTRRKYEKKVVQVNIPSYSSKSVSFNVTDLDGYTLSDVRFSRIRYSDSTIKDFGF